MPKRRVPPDEPSDPVNQALAEKVRNLFAERCAVFKIDPRREDAWMQLCYAFAFEHLFLAECRHPAKAKRAKPRRWGTTEDRRLLESVTKLMAGGKTVENSIKTLRLTNRFSGEQKSLETRYYEAKKRERGAKRDAIAEAMLRNSGLHRPSPSGSE